MWPLFALVYREWCLRFQHATLQVLWAIMHPFLLSIATKTAISKSLDIGFGRMAFCFAFWIYISTPIYRASQLFNDRYCPIKEITLPSFFVPLAAVLGGLPHLFIAVTGAMLFMCFENEPISQAIQFFPFVLTSLTLKCTLIVILLGVVGAIFKPITHIAMFVIQGLFLSAPLSSLQVNNEHISKLLNWNPIGWDFNRLATLNSSTVPYSNTGLEWKLTLLIFVLVLITQYFLRELIMDFV